ncbi:MAG: threonine synthase [Clostridia bacterium]|nr:threonine synthase [Clostridia bacterium]
MKYYSTRDTGTEIKSCTSAEAIKTGLAHDGGLFMPDSFPKIGSSDITDLCKLDYYKRASKILSMFLTDYNVRDIEDDCKEAYSERRFPGGPAPLVKLSDNSSVLELWHGPTCAFKDMALQIMPRLLSRALKMTGEKRKAHILVATSGDTGKAALEGYRDVDGIDITVFFPVDGVSAMQKLQMTTQLGENVDVCSVNGNFDDAQNGVKRIFSDPSAAEEADRRGFFLSSANSINWGRLAPQIVYYISAYCDLINSGKIKNGEKINFCVPTGNFGNIFAGRIAMEMGLPVNRLICASNSNCVLTDFIRTGTYDRTREFFKTMSPSMDILISSNLERLIWLTSGPEVTSDCMSKLSKDGKYTVPASTLSSIQNVFCGYYADESETASTINNTYYEKGYLADPHTSVALTCCNKYREETGDDTQTVILSTASPYKFAADVCRSLGSKAEINEPGALISELEKISNTKAPDQLKKTVSMPVRFDRVVDPDDMKKVIFN